MHLFCVITTCIYCTDYPRLAECSQTNLWYLVYVLKLARFIQTIFTMHGIIQWRCICFNVWTSVVHMDSGMQLALRNAASMQHKIGQLENSWTKSPSMWESCAACMSLARCVLTIRWAFQSVSEPLPWCIIIYIPHTCMHRCMSHHGMHGS